jgi:hypothetical protein
MSVTKTLLATHQPRSWLNDEAPWNIPDIYSTLSTLQARRLAELDGAALCFGCSSRHVRAPPRATDRARPGARPASIRRVATALAVGNAVC